MSPASPAPRRAAGRRGGHGHVMGGRNKGLTGQVVKSAVSSVSVLSGQPVERSFYRSLGQPFRGLRGGQGFLSLLPCLTAVPDVVCDQFSTRKKTAWRCRPRRNAPVLVVVAEQKWIGYYTRIGYIGIRPSHNLSHLNKLGMSVILTSCPRCMKSKMVKN